MGLDRAEIERQLGMLNAQIADQDRTLQRQCGARELLVMQLTRLDELAAERDAAEKAKETVAPTAPAEAQPKA